MVCAQGQPHVCAHACVWFSLSVVAAIAQLMSLGNACLTVLASHVATKVWPWLMPKGSHTCACVSVCLSGLLLAASVAVAAVAAVVAMVAAKFTAAAVASVELPLPALPSIQALETY